MVKPDAPGSGDITREGQRVLQLFSCAQGSLGECSFDKGAPWGGTAGRGSQETAVGEGARIFIVVSSKKQAEGTSGS